MVHAFRLAAFGRHTSCAMATHALIQTLANLKEQIPDEVHRQLGDKVQGVFEEDVSRGRLKKITYAVIKGD